MFVDLNGRVALLAFMPCMCAYMYVEGDSEILYQHMYLSEDALSSVSRATSVQCWAAASAVAPPAAVSFCRLLVTRSWSQSIGVFRRAASRATRYCDSTRPVSTVVGQNVEEGGDYYSKPRRP